MGGGHNALRSLAHRSTPRRDDHLHTDLDHFELVRRSLEADEHELVKGPVAATSEKVDKLIALADENGPALRCGSTFLFSPPVIAIRGVFRSGNLSESYFTSSSRVNLDLHQRDVSVLWDLAPHDFLILLDWLEEMLESAPALGRDSIVEGTPDAAFPTLSFPSGLLANIELSWLAPSKLQRTVLVGSEKMVVYDDASPKRVRIFDRGVIYHNPETFGEYQLSYRTGDIFLPKLGNEEPIALQLETFLAVERGGGDTSHIQLTRNVVELIEKAEDSLNNGGVPTRVASLDAARLDSR